MKRRVISFFLVLTILFSMIPITAINVSAATTLTITSPSEGAWLDFKSPGKVQWNTVTGAVGYKITIKNTQTNEVLVDSQWTTKTSYSLSGVLDKASSKYKVWVGAFSSKNLSDNYADKICDAIIDEFHTASSTPDVTLDDYYSITSDGFTLEMTIERDNGAGITDSGFYVGTSSSVSKMTKYSFKNYGNQSATAKGTKTMTITGLLPSTKYYFRAYATNSNGEECSDYDYCTTKASTSGSLSVSSTSVSMAWGSGNEASVTVTCGGTYTVSSPDYDVPSSVEDSDYNYQWLNVSKSGNTIRFTPNRANYSASARSATVTVSYGGQSKKITVTQKACGETAPKLTLKRSVTYSHRDDIGTFSLPQEDMDIDIYSQTNVRKLTAHLWDKGATSGFPIATCTDALSKGKIHFDISNLSAGDYEIRVYTSNSATENEYYKQTAFSNEPFLLYFSLTGGNTGNISITGITVPASPYPNGKSYNLTGTITSTYPLSKVIVRVKKASNNETVLSAEDSSINATTYDIKSNINYEVPFGTLPSGTYYLEYDATDSKKNNKVVRSSDTFTIGDVSYNDTVYYTRLLEAQSKLSSNQQDNLVNIATSQLGYEEVGGKSEYGRCYNNATGNWCANFVSWCADKAGLLGDKKPFKQGATANPWAMLNGGTVWYFYNSYKVNGTEWKSQNAAPGKTYEYFMSNMDEQIYDPNRSYCVPRAGDIIYFKASDNSAWAHVGIVTDYNSSSRTITYVDGNGTNEGGTLLQGKSGNVAVSKWSISMDKPYIMAIARPNYTSTSTHEHSYGTTVYYEAAHPHREYLLCSCGDPKYTGTTRKVAGCAECYPAGGDIDPAIPSQDLLIDSTVLLQNGCVYKDGNCSRTCLVKPYYYLNPDRDIDRTANPTTLGVIIDQFDVLNAHDSSDLKCFPNGFYYPYSGSTYCTTFARDVANAFGACFPSYVCSVCGKVKKSSSYIGVNVSNFLDNHELICTCGGTSSSLMAFHVSSASSQTAVNDPLCWMRKYGGMYGWQHITTDKVATATDYASKGYLTLGLYSDYEKHAGHVFVVYPSSDGKMHWAQAGGNGVLTDGSKVAVNDANHRDPSNSWIEYYVYIGIPDPTTCKHDWIEDGVVGNDKLFHCSKCGATKKQSIPYSGSVELTLSYMLSEKEEWFSESKKVSIDTEGQWTITDQVPTRSGYTFLGWALKPNATMAKYTAGDKLTSSTGEILYAVWKEKSSGGGGGGGTSYKPTVDNRTSTTNGAVVTFENSYKTAVVKCDKACVVVANKKGGSFERLTALKRSNDTYTFDLSGLSGEFTLMVALKGDADLDGKVDMKDATKVMMSWANETSLVDLAQYAADVKDPAAVASVDMKDATAIMVAWANETVFSWN